MRTRVKIGNLSLETAVMNAACSVAKKPADVAAMCKTKASVVLVGSITVEPREGNPHPRWHDEGSYALNSFGMPNKGLKYYKNALPKMIQATHEAGKLFALSVAGFRASDYMKLAQMAENMGVDFIELNFGCPNVQGHGEIASFNTDYMNRVTTGVLKTVSMPVMVKLSPYSNPAQLAEVAAMFSGHKIAAVVTSNSFPNSYMATLQGESTIGTELAGMNGRALLPVALGQVKQFRALLPERIAVIGVGGIETPEDVARYLKAGASAVQVATHIVRHGHRAIDYLIA